MDYKPLRNAMKRLELSDTPLKRKNALKAFDEEVKSIREFVAKEFPKLNKEGVPIVPRKKKGAYCWICKRPMSSMEMMARHICFVHMAGRKSWCVCGWTPKSNGVYGLIRHLAAQKDLKGHLLTSWGLLSTTEL